MLKESKALLKFCFYDNCKDCCVHGLIPFHKRRSKNFVLSKKASAGLIQRDKDGDDKSKIENLEKNELQNKSKKKTIGRLV